MIKINGMPFIIHEGVKYTQTRHAIQCKKCLDIIESTHIRDYKKCRCGAVGVDGGIADGNSIIGNPSDIVNKGEYCAKIGTETVWLPQSLLG